MADNKQQQQHVEDNEILTDPTQYINHF
jgi:hypothetical protein